MIVAIIQWLAAHFVRRHTKPLDTQQQHPTPEEAEVMDFWNRLRGPGYAPVEPMSEEEATLQYGTSHIQMKEYLEGWPGQDD